MIRIENLVQPSPEQWEIVIRGIRNAFKGQDKSDSGICENSEEEKELCYKGCQYVDHWEGEEPYSEPICGYMTFYDGPVFVLGEKDKKLALNLCKAKDPSERKFLRQLPIIMDITAPLYWWKQFDTYKVGTCSNSESTMHTLMKKPFDYRDFSVEYLAKIKESTLNGNYLNLFISIFLSELSNLRDWYLKLDSILNEIKNRETSDLKETKAFIKLVNENSDQNLSLGDVDILINFIVDLKADIFNALNQLLPQSYNQQRTISLNYEVLLTMIKQRKNHKLIEWKIFIGTVLTNVPMLKDFAIASGAITEDEIEKIRNEVSRNN